MKRKLWKGCLLIGTFLASGFLGQQAFAQDTSTSTTHNSHASGGIKGGVNISNLYVDDVNDENARIGFHVGVYGQLFASEVFAIQPEINYSTKGTRVVTEFATIDQTTKFNLNYIDIPVLAVFKLGQAVEIQAGPYWAYLVGANIDTEGDLGDDFREIDRDNFENWDAGIAGGIAFNLGAAKLGARYNYGLREIARSSGAKAFLGDSKNSVGQIYLALNFNHR